MWVCGNDDFLCHILHGSGSYQEGKFVALRKSKIGPAQMSQRTILPAGLCNCACENMQTLSRNELKPVLKYKNYKIKKKKKLKKKKKKKKKIKKNRKKTKTKTKK